MKLFLSLFAILVSFSSFANCDTKTFYFSTNGFHSDIIIETSDFEELHNIYPGSKYVAIGFGNLDFWESGDFFNLPFTDQIKIGSDALFTPAKGIISVNPLADYGLSYIDKKEKITISKSGYLSMIDSIRKDFALNQQNELNLRTSIYGYDLYDSHKSYHALNTCNTWISEKLRITGHFEIGNYQFANSLFKRIKKSKKTRKCVTHDKNTLIERLNKIRVK